VTINSEFPCIVCTQTNPPVRSLKILGLLAGNRRAMGWGGRCGEAYELVVPADGARGDEPELE